MPFLNELQQQLGPKGFQLLAVNLDDAEASLKKHSIDLSVVTDTDGQCPDRYGVQVMPP
jgi:hypothetical protein